jgi:hypothetical protein
MILRTELTATAAVLASALPLGAATVSMEAIEFHEDGSQTITITTPPSLEGNIARFTQVLPTNAGDANVAFRVFVDDKGDIYPSCSVSQRVEEVAFFDRATKAPVDANSNVQYAAYTLNTQGVGQDWIQNGFHVDKAGELRVNGFLTPLSVAAANMGLNGYMTVSQGNEVGDALLNGHELFATAYSQTKLVEVTIAGGDIVQEAWNDCARMMHDLETVEAAAAQATKDLKVEFSVVDNPPADLKRDLIANARGDIADMLAAMPNHDDVQVLEIQQVFGGEIYTLDAIQFIGPDGNTYISAGCYYKEVRDPEGNLIAMESSLSVTDGVQTSTCSGSADSVVSVETETKHFTSVVRSDLQTGLVKPPLKETNLNAPGTGTPNVFFPGSGSRDPYPKYPITPHSPSPIPLPMSALLLAGGLAGFGILGAVAANRKRNTAAAPRPKGLTV